MPPRYAAERQAPTWLLPGTVFTLKLLASGLVGAAITLVFWQGGKPRSLASDPFSGTFQQQEQQESTVYPRSSLRLQHSSINPDSGMADEAVSREIPLNFPRRVRTVTFTPPARYVALPDVGANPLAGKPLRYLIGTDSRRHGDDDEVIEVSYSTTKPAKRGVSIAYCNLFDEHNTGRYGPYLRSSDTAKNYNEGQIDPRGPGWEKNLREQFEQRKQQGFEYIELDNPDAYSAKDVIGAIDLAASYGLKVIAKNPLLLESGAASYVAHPNVYGIIVERGAGGAAEHDALRRRAGKPGLPTWFVSFGSGRSWAGSVASSAKRYHNMGVTYSSAGEYGNSIDILAPAAAATSEAKAL